METAADLIFEKRSRVCEIVVILFEYCNFSCEFCPQKHSDTLGMSYDEIMSKAEIIINYINNNKYATGFVVRLIGGEPFADEVVLKPFILQAYRDLTEKIRREVNIGDRYLHFMWISNFSMKECRKDILEFVEDQKEDTKFIVSFDLKGRFNKVNKEIFKENIEIFRDYIRNITTVMTRQNIECIVAGDEYYDYLYENFECSWDKYIKGDILSDYSVPKESQVLEFYKLLVNKYPEIEFIVPFVKKPEFGAINPASCSRGNGYAIDPDNSIISEGCIGTHYLKRKNVPAIVNITQKEFLNKSIEDFLEKYNCHACEYYQRCPMTCFTSLKAESMIEDMDTCINKLLFQYVDNKK
jgi:organic radical activating enzyme